MGHVVRGNGARHGIVYATVKSSSTQGVVSPDSQRPINGWDWVGCQQHLPAAQLMTLRKTDQRSLRGLKCPREFVESRERRILHPPLQLADVRPMNLGTEA